MRRAVLLLALAACGSKTPASNPPPPPPPAPDAGPAQADLPEALRAKAQAAVELVESLATAAEGAKATTEADCPAQAKALRAIADGPQGKAILTIDADPDFEKNAMAINDLYGKRLEAASDRLGEAIQICAYDPDVVQVLLDTALIQSPAEGEEEPVD